MGWWNTDAEGHSLLPPGSTDMVWGDTCADAADEF